MQQFQVPQFITVEDKVFGPFTIKQFIYLASGALLIVAARSFLRLFLFYPLAVFIGALAASLAFLKINEQPFPVVLKNAAFFILRPQLYIWKQKTGDEKTSEKSKTKKQETIIKTIPKLEESRLSDLAWSLDVHEKIR